MERARVIIISWLALIVVPAMSHSPSADGPRASVQLFSKDGKMGLKDESGNVLIPAEYEALGWSDSEVALVDRVIGYKAGGMWGLIHISNKIITPPEYAGLNPGGGSWLIAQKTSISRRPAFGVITTSGKVAIPLVYDGLSLSNMRAVVMTRSLNTFKFGLTDLDNRVIIPLEYRRIYPLGSLRFAVENFSRKTAIFSDQGTQLTAFDIDSLSAFRNNYAVVYRNHRQGVLDRQGNMVIASVYAEVKLDNGAILAREPHSYTLLTGQNQATGHHVADGLSPLSPDHYAVATNGKILLADNRFDLLNDDAFTSISDFQDDRAITLRNGLSGVIASDGHFVIPEAFDHISMEGNVFRARHRTGPENRWSLLDGKGNELTDRRYALIAPWNGHFFPVLNRGHWGALNKHGEQIIGCVYDSLTKVRGRLIAVKFKNAYGVIDMDGDWIVAPGKHEIGLIDDELYLEYADSTTFLKAIPGRVIYFTNNRLEYSDGSIREILPSGAFWTISRSGVIIGRSEQPENTEKVFDESEGYRAIRKDGKYGFIDREGRLRIANRYEGVRPFSDGMAAIRIQGKWGFIDRHENLKVQPVYDDVEPFVNGVAIVSQNGLFGVVGKDGKQVLPLRYDSISRTASQRLLLKRGDLYGLADHDGRIITHPRYHSLTETPGNYIIIVRDGRHGLITLEGVSTIPMIYDELAYDRFRDQFLAMKRSEWKQIVSLK